MRGYRLLGESLVCILTKGCLYLVLTNVYSCGSLDHHIPGNNSAPEHLRSKPSRRVRLLLRLNQDPSDPRPHCPRHRSLLWRWTQPRQTWLPLLATSGSFQKLY